MSKKLHLNPEWLRLQLATKSCPEIAFEIGVSPRAVQAAAQKFRRLGVIPEPEELAEKYMAQLSLNIVEEIVLTGDGLLSCDWHLPITRVDLIADAINEAVEYGTTDYLVIAGDLFNMDHLSKYYPKQKGATVAAESRMASELLQRALEVFDLIAISLGNHDVRFADKLGWAVNYEDSIRMLLPGISDEDMKRILITPYDYVMIDTPEGPWRACHTREYRRQPLSLPIALADRYQQHIFGGHRHHHGIARSATGWWAIDGGGFFDTEQTSYLKTWTTTHPGWQPGYALLKSGVPYLPLLAPRLR